MLKEENIYILNLKHRKDRLLFTKIKMYRAGFDLSKINFIEAVYGKKDKECIEVFNSLPVSRRKSGMCQPVNNIGALGLLKTYRNILEDAINKDLDYVALVEDDNYYHPKLLNKLRECTKFLDENDILWVGSNQCMYLPNQVEKIKRNMNYNLGNGHIAGTFFIILSKRMYTFIYNYLRQNFKSNIYPIDVLLDLTLKNNKWKALILYPRPVIPEIRDSDNMGPRNHIAFYNSRRMNNFEEYDCINLYDIISNYHSCFTFEMYKEIYDNLDTNSFRLQNKKLGRCSQKITNKIFEQDKCSFHFILNGDFDIKPFIESLEKQNYNFWRISLITNSKENIDYVNKSKYKNKINLLKELKDEYDKDELILIIKNKCTFTLPIILNYINMNMKNKFLMTSGYKENDKHYLKNFEINDKLLIIARGKINFTKDELKGFDINHSRIPIIQR